MSDTKHTPGTWLLRHNGDGSATIYAYADGKTETYIATVWPRQRKTYRGGPKRKSEVEANARLIAAAPDLLAACRATTVLRREPDGAIVIGPRGFEMIRAACAKAKGE